MLGTLIRAFFFFLYNDIGLWNFSLPANKGNLPTNPSCFAEVLDHFKCRNLLIYITDSHWHKLRYNCIISAILSHFAFISRITRLPLMIQTMKRSVLKAQYCSNFRTSFRNLNLKHCNMCNPIKFILSFRL